MKAILYFIICGLISTTACQSQDVHNCAFPYSKHAVGDRCGLLTVPENRQNPNSKKIQLAYLVIKSKSSQPKSDPVVFLQGGPGGVVLPLADAYSNLQLDEDRDFVLFDPRGTGYSQALCPDLMSNLMEVLAMDIQPEQEYQALEKFLKICQQDVQEQDIDLNGYNSQENVYDLEDLREHLGYDQWNIFGGSYGSRLGLLYMDLFPNSIRSATLVGIFPPQIRMYDDLISNFNQSLQKVFSQCAQDPDCRERYPDLKQEFLDTFAELKGNPIRINWKDKPFTLNAQDMLLFIHQRLYTRNSIATVPFLIRALKDRDQNVLKQASADLNKRMQLINLATYWSVMTCDEGVYDNKQKLQADLAKNPQYQLGIGVFSTDPLIYETWNANASCYTYLEAVASDIPTLLVSGTFDPVTPPANAEQAAKYLRNSQLITFTNEGHAPFNSCFFDLAKSFLNDPNRKLNTSCAQKERNIRWR